MIFTGSLCGLCGNFNSVPKDDMTTRDEQVVYDVNVFASSWRVGGKNACSRSLKPVTQPSPCFRKSRRIHERMCKPLKQRMFGACHKKLNQFNFYRSVRRFQDWSTPKHSMAHRTRCYHDVRTPNTTNQHKSHDIEFIFQSVA